MSKKVSLLALGFVTLAFSSCGRNDFNGRYTGFETTVANPATAQPQQQQPGTNPVNTGWNNNAIWGVGAFGANQSYPVTLELREDNDQVRGNYRLADGSFGDFRASAAGADRLTNVRLTITQVGTGQVNGGGVPQFNVAPTYSMSFCNLYTGELRATNRGRRIEGTLNSQNTNNQVFATPCFNKQISLDRD